MKANEFTESLRTENPCWKGYHPVGTKKKNGKTVPNCVPNANEAANPAQQAAIAIAKKKKQGVAEGLKDTVKQKAKQFGKYMTEPQGPQQELVRNRAKNIDKIRKNKEQGVAEDDAGDVEQRMIAKIEKEKQRLAKLKQTDPEAYKREMEKRKTSSRVPPVSTFEEQGVAEGLPQTLRKVVPGHAKREIDKKMDAGKFGKTDADKDANFQRYKKIQDKIKEQGVAEGFNGEYDDEAGMAHTNLHTIARAAQGLLDTIDDQENLPEWVQEKIAKVEGMMVTAWNYLKSQEEQGINPRQELDELSPQTLASYVRKSNADARDRLRQDPKKQLNKARKRAAGMSQAIGKIRATMEPSTNQQGSLKEFAPVGGDDREPNEEEILKQLAAHWWLGTEQQMAKAQKTLASMGWEIGQDESGDDDAGVFLIRAGDVNGDSYIAFNHSDLELNEDRLDELSFLGSQCTKDCSGHRAGYEWYKRKGRDPFSHSQSFNNGAGLAKAGK